MLSVAGFQRLFRDIQTKEGRTNERDDKHYVDEGEGQERRYGNRIWAFGRTDCSYDYSWGNGNRNELEFIVQCPRRQDSHSNPVTFKLRREKEMKEMISIMLMKVRDKRGATAIEYGLLAGLIAVMIIAGATVTGTSLSSLFNAIGGRIPTVIP